MLIPRVTPAAYTGLSILYAYGVNLLNVFRLRSITLFRLRSMNGKAVYDEIGYKILLCYTVMDTVEIKFHFDVCGKIN